jgi:DNA-binding NarL/FixJ family response regulator
MTSIRIAVIEDQDLVRAGLVSLLRSAPGFEVAGEAADGRAGVALVQATHPDIALLDIRMPVMNGLDAIAAIRRDPACAGTRIVVLTTFGVDDYLFGALRAGASGFLLKDTRPEEFLQAIRVIADGDALVSPSMTRRLIEKAVQRPHTSGRLPELTERERDILRLVCEGLSNTQIAERLVIGQATVKTYVSRLLAKFDVQTRVELVIATYERGGAPS